ncbi:hypothetical protein BLX90_16450 [Rhizobium sp. Y9]|nr:hypothetical protein BLX90_16450 [Rhizobium sp. Y9]PTV69007.1 hypothetical protein DBL06_27620 [Agrobacterium pusense]
MNEKRQFREADEPCTKDIPRQTSLKALHGRGKPNPPRVAGGYITRKISQSFLAAFRHAF